MDLHIAQTLFDAVDATLNSTLVQGTARLMAGVGGVFGTAWLLTFSFSALRWLQTGLTETVEDILWRILRMAIIVSFAFSVPWYLAKIVPIVTGLPVWMGGVMSGNEAHLTNQVDDLLNHFIQAIIDLTDAMSFDVVFETGVVVVGICILVFMCLGGIPFIGICIGTLIVLKVATSLFLAVGPLFIAFLLFEQTKGWFWNWIGIIAGFILTNVLFSVVIGLALNFINSIVLKTGTIEATWSDAVSVLFYFGALTMLAEKIPDYAATAMGGVSSGSTGIKAIAGKMSGVSTAKKMSSGAAKMIAKRIRNRNRIE